MSNSRANQSRTERRRAAVERRRAHSRRGITASVAARRRRSRIRWGITAGVAALLVGGTVVYLTTRDEGGIPNVALSGEEVDAEGALGITAPLDSYTIDYDVTNYGGDPENPQEATQQVKVSRPFTSQVTITEGEGDAATVSTYTSVLGTSQSASAGGDPVAYVSAPVGALYDWRLDASLEDLVGSGEFQLQERRNVIGRDCQVYRTGSAIESFTITAATADTYADVCIDASGLVLEEVVYQSGIPARHLVATNVSDAAVTDIAVTAEPTDSTTTLTEIDSTAAPVDGYWSLTTVPDGYELTARYEYSVPGEAAADTSTTDSTDPTASTTVAPEPAPILSYIDVYTSGGDYLIVRQGPTSQQSSASGTSGTATIEALGDVTTSSGVDGSTIIANPAAPADWFVSLNGSVDMATLTTIAGTLAPPAA